MLKIAGGGVYGILGENYYKKSILRINELGAQIDNISIITDDKEYANSFNLSAKGVEKPNIICCNLSDTLAIAVGADWFISSNSTLSYWIVKLKGGTGCVVPEPFQKVSDFSLPEKCMRVPAEFKN